MAYEIMHKAGSCIEEMPYCFGRSSAKFQGRTALKIIKFDPNWAFPDCNSSLNSPMAMKCCTKLETAKERCTFVFQGHPSNFKVTRYKTSPILTQIGRFRTIGRSQISNPSDLPCCLKFKIYSCDQAYLRTLMSVRLSVRLSNTEDWIEPMGSYHQLTDIVLFGFQKRKQTAMTNQREMLAIEEKRLALEERKVEALEGILKVSDDSSYKWFTAK